MKTRNDTNPVSVDLSFRVYERCGWRPNADIYRSTEGLLVKLELAGVSEHDIKISASSDYIVIEGKRRDWCVPDIREPLSMEITYDRFTRLIRLPAEIEPEALVKEFRDGMLLVYLRYRANP
ncbi:MAG: Hsp20/alpha crystallin family protein [Gammaproteobacteria bacterium]|jgi:HSP20 family protein|nr:Hsp20/alpha crystallin family protein [Gammaproteobacteria bacterium]